MKHLEINSFERERPTADSKMRNGMQNGTETE